MLDPNKLYVTKVELVSLLNDIGYRESSWEERGPQGELRFIQVDHDLTFPTEITLSYQSWAVDGSLWFDVLVLGHLMEWLLGVQSAKNDIIITFIKDKLTR